MSVGNENKNNETSMASQQFNNLKEFFKSEINSNRIFESISNVGELIDVLEDRDALTDDVLLKLDPHIKDLVNSKRKSSNGFENSVLPINVAELINENFETNWKELGLQLKLSQEQLNECKDVGCVLLCFKENCEGISNKEMIFKLIRALEKNGRKDLKTKIEEMT